MTRNIEAIRILVVEDEPFIAWDIAEFLREAGYEIQDICYDAASATESIENNKPDLCILDINLGKGPDGISLGHTINSKWRIPFIYLTSYTDDTTLERAKKNMPYGYISKPIQFESLKSTIEITLHNFKNQNTRQAFTIENINKVLIAELTPREFELLKDMYDGKTNKQLTAIHFISSNTVKSHVNRIYEKFDCHSRAEVIAKIRKILAD